MNIVKEVREQRQLTQEELANTVGISRRTLVSIETKYSVPAVDTALRLSRVLQVDVDKLFIVPDAQKAGLGLQLPSKIKFIDLFCGIGGFRYAANQCFKKYGIDGECVFSSDIDKPAQESYHANFGEWPSGDITKVDALDIPDFDLLFGGFPCQAFSIIGKREGFADKTRGTLFFEIARILKEKRPQAFVLENVKQLVTHDNGRTISTILSTLREELGYYVDYKILNALDYGLPQKRERVVIVGSTRPFVMKWPEQIINGKTLEDVLEKEVDKKYYASSKIVEKRKSMHTSKYKPAIWHENKAGNITSYPYSCALRAGASYNYLLVDGKRRLTPRECLRLQGFPDEFRMVVSDCQIRKQAGNAVPVDMIRCVLESFIPIVFGT
jgi:DNA (cytosine-5)-methyltransferase 1